MNICNNHLNGLSKRKLDTVPLDFYECIIHVVSLELARLMSCSEVRKGLPPNQ